MCFWLISKKLSSRSSQIQTSPSASSSTFTSTTDSAKLEDLFFPQVLNHLTPSNIKKTANKLLNEWEKSLTPPDYVAAAASNGNKVKGT